MKSLDDLTIEKSEFFYSYKHEKDEYRPIPHTYYDLRRLQRIPEDQIDSKLYTDEDFVVWPKNSSFPKKLKAGYLFIDFSGADRSLAFTIELIDKEKGSCSPFVSFAKCLNPVFYFQDIMPFVVFPLTTKMRVNPEKDSVEVKEQKSIAFKLKELFIELMCGRDLTAIEMANFEVYYKALRFGSDHRRNDVSQYSVNPKLTTIFSRQIAAKLFSIACLKFNLSKEQIVSVLEDYLKLTKKHPDCLDEGFQAQILNTAVDKNRLPLRSVVMGEQEDGKGESKNIDILLREAVVQIQKKRQEEDNLLKEKLLDAFKQLIQKRINEVDQSKLLKEERGFLQQFQGFVKAYDTDDLLKDFRNNERLEVFLDRFQKNITEQINRVPKTMDSTSELRGLKKILFAIYDWIKTNIFRKPKDKTYSKSMSIFKDKIGDPTFFSHVQKESFDCLLEEENRIKENEEGLNHSLVLPRNSL